MAAAKSKAKVEFGDFQTPDELALQACQQLAKLGVKPEVIIEPTCGLGSFVRAALATFKEARSVLGIEINPEYAAKAEQGLGRKSRNARIVQGDCFKLDWSELASEGRPLVLGNPPWVTSATIGTIGGSNVPEKSNFQGRKGFDAITGKANFDISEWMLLRAIEWLAPRDGQLAMLVKTSVARKVLLQCWRKGLPMEKAALWDINAKEHFDASVPACFLFISFKSGASSKRCDHYSSLSAARKDSTFGEVDGLLVADIGKFEKWKHLRGSNPHFVWRSGVKHDCSPVMELAKDGKKLINGLGEEVNLERRYVFPMLKSSHVARGATEAGRFMIVTQTKVGEDTSPIARHAPKTWAYLNSHRDKMDARRSSIYRGKPPFSIFGVGPYSFAPWKIAIAGLYKKLTFTVLPPIKGVPVMPDDTIYFLPCRTAEEAEYVSGLLASEPAREFFTSLIFWSEKRPVSTDILRSLSLPALANELGSLHTYNRLVTTTDDLPLFAVAV